LHFWQLGGNSELWLRLPSVVSGVGTVLTLFVLNDRLFQSPVATASAARLAFNLFFIRYVQEARVYSLALWLVVLASYFFVVALDRPSLARWTTYAVVSTLAVYAHVFSGLVIAGHFVSLRLRPDRVRHRHRAGAYLLIAALTSPLVALMIATKQTGRSFIPKPGLDSFEWLFLHFTGGAGLPSRGARLVLLSYFLLCGAAVLVGVHKASDADTAGR